MDIRGREAAGVGRLRGLGARRCVVGGDDGNFWAGASLTASRDESTSMGVVALLDIAEGADESAEGSEGAERGEWWVGWVVDVG